MQFDKISIASIEMLSEGLEKIGFSCKALLRGINAEVEKQYISDTYEKIVIRNIAKSVSTVVLDCNLGKIDSMSFYGSIDIRPKELLAKFGSFREAYSSRDGLYFYFFNEDKNLGNYNVSFFDQSNNLNIKDNGDRISNFTLSNF